MGYVNPTKEIPAKLRYDNFISKKQFQVILKYCLDASNADDTKLVEQLFLGALAAVELDCVADMNNKGFDVEPTKVHYREYIDIANKVLVKSGSNREELRAFISRMNKYCSPSDQISFFAE